MKKIATILIIFSIILGVAYIIMTIQLNNNEEVIESIENTEKSVEEPLEFFTEDDFKTMYSEQELEKSEESSKSKKEKLSNTQTILGLDTVIKQLIEGVDWELHKDITGLEGRDAFAFYMNLTENFIDKYGDYNSKELLFEDHINKSNLKDLFVWNDSYNFYVTIYFEALPETVDTAVYTLKLNKEGKIDDFNKVYSSFEAEYTPIDFSTNLIDYIFIAYDYPVNRPIFDNGDNIMFTCPIDFIKIFGNRFTKDNIYDIETWEDSNNEYCDDNLASTNHWVNLAIKIAEDDGYFWKYRYKVNYTTGENLCLTSIEAKFIKKLRGSKIEKESTTKKEVVENEE